MTNNLYNMKNFWLWLKDENNNRAVSIVLQLVTMGSAIYFGYQGLSSITELNVNLKELKAESIEAERATVGDRLEVGCKEGDVSCVRLNNVR
jgi:hypothetical protein